MIINNLQLFFVSLSMFNSTVKAMTIKHYHSPQIDFISVHQYLSNTISLFGWWNSCSTIEEQKNSYCIGVWRVKYK